MAQISSKEQFIDKLLEECEDQIENKDVKGILDWFNKKLQSKDRISNTSVCDVFIKLFTNILNPSELEQNKNIFGPDFYVLLASYMKVSDIIFNFPDNNYDDWSQRYILPYVQEYKNLKPTFNSIRIETATPLEYVHCNCSDCCVNITKSSSKHDYLDLKAIECKNLVIKFYIVGNGGEYISINSVENIIYKDYCIIQNTIPRVTLEDNGRGNLKSIVLPKVDGIQIPRWVCNINDSLIIYKSKNQKVNIYSSNKEWLKNHIKYTEDSI